MGQVLGYNFQFMKQILLNFLCTISQRQKQIKRPYASQRFFL